MLTKEEIKKLLKKRNEYSDLSQKTNIPLEQFKKFYEVLPDDVFKYAFA